MTPQRAPRSGYDVAKRAMDVTVAGVASVVLTPVWLPLLAAIKLDSRGPLFFRQRRIGRDNETFEILKFRTMRVDTPSEVPTHQLADPATYITKVGRFLRRTSLDELPQLINILRGEMSLVGPRPALWNQDDLIAERDRYGANAVLPGLTGWAQINGRDELEIPVKARLDGDYVARRSIPFDVRILFGTVAAAAKGAGVAEGGPRAMASTGIRAEGERSAPAPSELSVTPPSGPTKRVLIVGQNSYIGGHVESRLKEFGDAYQVDVVGSVDGAWKVAELGSYDSVLHVAGIAHVSADPSLEAKYMAVNRDLPIEVATACRAAGTRQFIFMSSVIVDSKDGRVGESLVIERDTRFDPADFYEGGKADADQALQGIATDDFAVVCVRTPMVFGKNAKGNFPRLLQLARKTPVFPAVDNLRSMIYVENLAEFIRRLVDTQLSGVVFPQNPEPFSTADIVQTAGAAYGRRIHLTRVANPLLRLASSKVDLVNKVFGSKVVSKAASDVPFDYIRFDNAESLRRSV